MSATSRGAGSRSGAQPGQSITVSNFDSSTSEPEVGLASLKAGVEEKEKEKGHPGASETKGSPQPAVPTTNSGDSERKNSSDFFGGGDGDLDRDDSDGSQVEVESIGFEQGEVDNDEDEDEDEDEDDYEEEEEEYDFPRQASFAVPPPQSINEETTISFVVPPPPAVPAGSKIQMVAQKVRLKGEKKGKEGGTKERNEGKQGRKHHCNN